MISISTESLCFWTEVHLPQLGTKLLRLLVFNSWTLFASIFNLFCGKLEELGS